MATTQDTNSLESRFVAATTGDELDYGFIYDIEPEDVNKEFVQMINRRLGSAQGQDKIRVLEALDLWIIDHAATNFYEDLVSEGTLPVLLDVFTKSDDSDKAAIKAQVENWSNMVQDGLHDEITRALEIMNQSPPPPPPEDVLPRGPRLAIPYYQVKPTKAIADCLDSTYRRVTFLLSSTRKLPFFRQQCFHLINQAFHLVLRLNDEIEYNEPTLDQADQDELLGEDIEALEDLYEETLEPLTKETVDDEKEECLLKLSEVYDRLYCTKRPFFTETRAVTNDRAWRKMIKYDNRTIRRSISNASLEIQGISIHTTQRVRGSLEGHLSSVPSSASQSRAGSPPPATAAAEGTAAVEGQDAPTQVEGSTTEGGELVASGSVPIDTEEHSGPIVIEDEATIAAINNAAFSDSGSELGFGSDGGGAGPSKRADKGKGRAVSPEDAAPPVDQKHCSVPGCRKAFDDDEQLRTHMKEHDEKPYHCQYCGEDFSTFNAHRTHEGVHWLRRRIHYLMRTNQWPPTMPANATYGQQPPGMAGRTTTTTTGTTAAGKRSAPALAPIVGPSVAGTSGASGSGSGTQDVTAGSKVGTTPGGVDQGVIQGSSAATDTVTSERVASTETPDASESR